MFRVQKARFQQVGWPVMTLVPAIVSQSPRAFRVFLVLTAVFVGASGCAPPQNAQINDPDEAFNRQIHNFNKGVDSYVLRPVATALVPPGGGPISQGVVNFASNLSAPGDVLNNILQIRLGRAVENTLRFAINSTIGVAGLFDVAQKMGVSGRDTDFGETLHVWGFAEGRYLDAPLVGPTTSRDLTGKIVDIAINPLQIWLPAPDRSIGTVAGAAAGVVNRGRYVSTVDSILYQSADSYAHSRILYLQNRRFKLGQSTGEDAMIDPYEDLYAE